MSKWKEQALKKKNYRRGGQEPDPPKNARKSKRLKPFKLQRMWWRTFGWSTMGKYHTFEIALEVARNDWRKFNSRYKHIKDMEFRPYRIINMETRETITYTSPESLMED